MSNEIAVIPQAKPSALAVMAGRINVEPSKLHSTLKNTVFKGATDDELLALVVTANTYELNPLLKELYAFPKKGGGIAPMVGVDGWIKIANRQPNFDGMDVEVFGDGKTPTHATGTIYLKDRSHPVRVTEYFEECKRGTEPWNQMPRRMLRNKAIIQSIRLAFGVSGIHDEDEARDIGGRQAQAFTADKPVFKARVIDPEDNIPMLPDPRLLDAVPAFTPDTPQKQLQAAIADAGVLEGAFIKQLKVIAPALIGKAKLITELSDEAAEKALAEIHSILAEEVAE